MKDEKEPDIAKYCHQMEEIKLRTNVVTSFLHGQSSAVYTPTTIECACLQIRKILELIAFASLIANKEAYTKVFSKVSKAWNAGDLLKELERVNPGFYPVPVTEVPSKQTGAEIGVNRPQTGRVPDEDGICGGLWKMRSYCARCKSVRERDRLRVLSRDTSTLAKADCESSKLSPNTSDW